MDEDFEFEEKDEMEDGIDNEKHWKSLGIALAVISIICFLILMAIFILTPSNNSGLKQESYTLSEVVGKKIIEGNRFNGTWISGHEFLYQSSDKNIMIYDCYESKIKPITTKLNTTKIEIIRFEMSTSGRYVLLVATTPESSEKMANLECDPSLVYYIYDLTNENLINLQDKFQQMLKKEKNHNDDESVNGKESNKATTAKQDTNKAISFRSSCLIQSTQWNPWGNILLIMHHNDIYWFDMDPNQDARGLNRLTNDGSIKDSIYNGYNDYVYRDLIFERPTSVWWSPNAHNGGHYLFAYLKINNSKLPLNQVLNYIDDGEGVHYRYSNINSSIGDVSLWLIEIDGNESNPGNRFSSPVQIKPPDKLNRQEYYLVHVDWINQDKIVVLWTLRNQKQSLLGACERQKNWQCDALVTMKNWLHMNHVPQSILAAGRTDDDDDDATNNDAENQELFFCGQTPENGVKTLHQLYSFNVKTKVINSYLNMAPTEPDSSQQQQHQSFQLQQKYYQIIELLGHDPRSKWIFFVGKSLNNNNDEQNEISEQEMRVNLFIFSIDFNTVHCITCQLVRCFRLKQTSAKNNGNSPGVCIDFKHSAVATDEEEEEEDQDQDGESCIFQRIYMSPTSEYAIITCLIGIVPKVYLIRFTNIYDHQHADIPEKRLDLIENITLFEDNTDLENRMANKLMPNVESFVFHRENDNLIKYLRIKLLTPPDFNDEDLAKYPLLFEMYPSRNVFHHTSARKSSTHLNGRVFHTDAYPNIEWAVHMVTKHEFIYAWLDGHFYQDSNHSIHETSFEELIDDYATLIDFIQTNMTFINPLKTCLIGNNIGAYFVLNSLATTSIQCGISISPFIDWNTINSFIAEQYINLDRIRSNDLQYLLKMTLNHKMLVDKNLLIIHGTSNELYPVRHTMKLMKRLTFDEQIRYVKETNAVNEEFEINITNHHFLELYVDQGNSFDRIIEHFYIKIEFFLFQWIIV